MACPSYGILNRELTFSVRSYDRAGEPTDADSLPTYRIYEDGTNSSILTGTMSKFDDDNTTGFYKKTIIISPTYFTRYTTYIIDIIATIDGTDVAMSYSFLCVSQEDQIGYPSTTIELGDLRVVSSYRGEFKQGTLATLFVKITDFDGNPITAEAISVTIEDPSGDTASTGTPELVTQGFYAYDWTLDTDQTIGKYTVTWDYTISGSVGHEYQYIIVSENDSDYDTQYYSGRRLAFRMALEDYLACAQAIPVYNEQAKPTRNNQTFEWTFSNWNQTSGVRIYRNQNIMTSGIEIDYFNGKVYFDSQLLDQDIVNADYNFRWFTDEQLDNFLNSALQSVNLYPPASSYSMLNVPDRFIPIVLYGAARDALRQLLMCINFQEPAQLFGGDDKAQQKFSQLESLKKNYEDEFIKFLEQKKLGPYPKSTTIVVPEYTLPGGRSRWFRYLFH